MVIISSVSSQYNTVLFTLLDLVNMQHSVKRFPIGSHLIVKHLGYSHHGIYAGRGRVIHYSGLAHLFKKKPIEITTLEQFSHGKKSMSVITIIQI
jgi:hypothetical protein